jgi:hypothetical protein
MVAATSSLTGDARLAMHDPVTAITSRIERARARLRQERAASRAYGVFEEGQLIGSIRAPDGIPRFGPAAPTVLLTKTESGEPGAVADTCWSTARRGVA